MRDVNLKTLFLQLGLIDLFGLGIGLGSLIYALFHMNWWMAVVSFILLLQIVQGMRTNLIAVDLENLTFQVEHLEDGLSDLEDKHERMTRDASKHE